MKNKESAFHKNMEIMTKKSIASMEIIKSEGDIKLLKDTDIGFYVILNEKLNATHYIKSNKQAEKFYRNQITIKNN